jgi:hypothetical protein
VAQLVQIPLGIVEVAAVLVARLVAPLVLLLVAVLVLLLVALLHMVPSSSPLYNV